MATINVLDSTGATVAIEKPLVPGRAAAASSRPVALSTEDAAFLDGIEGSLGAVADAAWTSGSGSHTALLKAIATQMLAVDDPLEYEVVAASGTDVILGATGAIGDYLEAIRIDPATAGCGSVIVKDGSTTIYTFPGGGTTALPTLAPIYVPFGINAVGAGWKITTGANVAVTGFGNFT